MKMFVRVREWTRGKLVQLGEVRRVEIQFGAAFAETGPPVVRWRIENGKRTAIFDMTPEAARDVHGRLGDAVAQAFRIQDERRDAGTC